MVKVMILMKMEIMQVMKEKNRMLPDKQARIDSINSELHILYKGFYSRKTKPITQRYIGCRIIKLKKELDMLYKSKDTPYLSNR